MQYNTKYNQNVQIKYDEMDGASSMHGKKFIVYRILVGEPEGKRPLGRPIRRLKNNIKMDLRLYSMVWYGLD
jgi:hypothetical protein